MSQANDSHAEPPQDPCLVAARSMTCQHCIEFLMDYLDGAVSAEERFKFESHLAFCPDCEAYVNNYRAAVELARRSGGGNADRRSPDGAVPQGLIDAILKARKQA